MSTASLPKIALVIWLDARRTDEEVTAPGAIGVVRETVGWVLRDDAEGVVISFTRDLHAEGTSFERGFFIPRLYVQKRRWLT